MDLIPNDVLCIIFSFVESLKDYLSLLLVSKRFYFLTKHNQPQWKICCLRFWDEFKQKITVYKTGESNCNYCQKGDYDLERIQRESGKDWFWFSRCFANGRVFKSDFREITIGIAPDGKVNGWGIRLYPQTIYIGTFINNILNGYITRIGSDDSRYNGQCKDNEYHGSGTLVYNSGVKYEGEWAKGLPHGHGSITYSDEIKYQGQWRWSHPDFDPRHPIVKECIEQKRLCTNTLSRAMPQRMGGYYVYYCETCWNYCKHRPSINLR
jgi:hypothetical protein